MCRHFLDIIMLVVCRAGQLRHSHANAQARSHVPPKRGCGRPKSFDPEEVLSTGLEQLGSLLVTNAEREADVERLLRRLEGSVRHVLPCLPHPARSRGGGVTLKPGLDPVALAVVVPSQKLSSLIPRAGVFPLTKFLEAMPVPLLDSVKSSFGYSITAVP